MLDLDKLLEEAKSLGIKNADKLDVDSLLQAIDEKKAKAKETEDAKAKAEAEAKAKAEADAKAKADADAKAKTEAEAKAKSDADAKAKAEAEAKAKSDADAKAKAEAEANAKTKTSWTDNNGTEWGFKKTAPESINWNGKIRTQEDLLNDDSVMKKLTLGQYSFIKKLS
ncbi:MAG: cell envelope integrity protein TolA [Flavobacteriales bacterium]